MSEKRPILTLKRKRPAEKPVPETAVPVTLRHRKTLPALDRPTRDQANPATSQPDQPKKKKNKSKPLRLIDEEQARATLSMHWPALFSHATTPVLKIHVFQDMHHDHQTRSLPLSVKQLRRCINTYVRSTDYLEATRAGAPRYGIDGQVAGEVSEREHQYALKQLAHRQRQADKARASEGA
ncbi:MAG: ProQ/FINO family protein [Pantoea sp.]|nr:ProQ/FINO family protein [Pantoea sp.]